MLTLNVPAESRYVGTVRSVVAALLENLGVVADDVYDVGLILGEVCSNVVRHAYGGRAGHYTVQAEITGDVVVLTISDRGCGIDPARRKLSEPDRHSGWGLWLIERLSDDVTVGPLAPSGTEVRVEKKLRFCPTCRHAGTEPAADSRHDNSPARARRQGDGTKAIAADERSRVR